MLFVEVSPKTSILRIRGGAYANSGKKRPDIPARVIRRCYYCDFEMAVNSRKELLQSDAIDYMVLSDDVRNVKMLPRESFDEVCSQLVKYPFRAKPVYLEGVWG